MIDKQNKAEKLQKEMIEIVKSEEAKQVVEEGLKNLDPKALTPEGVIQSYEIDYNSIEHNPMGGINVTLFINKKNSQDIEFNVIKKEGKLLLEGVDLSGDLSKRIKEKGYE